MNEIKKSYFAIIPANVRYDKNLIPSAKLLYGEITALSNEKGYCWATNKYFAELYNVSEKSITTWINSLIKAGHIERKLIYKIGNKEIEERRLYLTLSLGSMEEKVDTYGRKGVYPMEENFHTPMEEKVRDNNTVFNNTINNTRESEREKEHTHTHKTKVKKEKPLDEGDIVEQLEEFVKMKRKEYKKLIELYDEEVIEDYIKKLDNYKGAKGKTYKNDYRAILIWLDKDKVKQKVKNVI